MRSLLLILSATLLAACAVPQMPPAKESNTGTDSGIPQTRAREFATMVERVEPVAEAKCRELAPRENCDFLIVIDDTPRAPANAFQTRDGGRPVIGFTLAMIGAVENADELAFILSHEAAHHIRGHLARQNRNAQLGAELMARVAGAAGGSRGAIERAAQVGAVVGARSYSKDFELEADELGTVIAYQAGYDPLRGAAFFARIPDPGDRFLGTHPANRERVARVQQTLAQISRGS